MVGYVAVIAAFVSGFALLSETFVSIIFLSVAIFVFMGVDVQSRLLDEVEQTIEDILPICAKCKKIRDAQSDPDDQESWSLMENYIAEKMDVGFSHGYCPQCFDEEIKNIDAA